VSFVVNDAVQRVLGLALDGVSLRQRTIADNIANVDTPGFRATSVDFESSLRQAVADGEITDRSSGGVSAEATPTDTPVGANGNNVDLRQETLAAVQSQYQYQVLTRAVTDRFNVLRDSLGSM
jgi:flagellar basal-body rod protein FlgB